MTNLTILEAFSQTLSATKKYVNNRIDGLASETYVDNAVAGFASKADPSFTGNVTVAGKVTVSTAPTADMDVATKKYVDDNIINKWVNSSIFLQLKLKYSILLQYLICRFQWRQ